MSSILHIKSHFCNTPRDLYIITQKQKLTQKNKLFYPHCHVNKFYHLSKKKSVN